MRSIVATAVSALMAFAVSARLEAVAPDKRFEQFARDTWSVEQGLPQISVAAVAQGSDGYIWAATQQGLARFDGVSFQVFRPEDTPALPGRLISALLRDSRGRLWIGTRQGAAIYDAGGFSTVPLEDRTRSATSLSFWVSALAELPGSNHIVALTSGGLFRSRGEPEFVAWPVLDRDRPQAILAARDGLWAGLIGEVAKVSAKDETVERWKLPKQASDLPVTALAEYDGALWIGTRHGVYVLERDGIQPLQLPIPETDMRVTALFADSGGSLWVGVEPALLRIRGRAVTEVLHEREFPAVTNIAAFAEDREGNLWLGSSLTGLTRVWDGWVQRYSRGQGLDDPTAWSVAAWTQGRLLVGVRSGVRVFDGTRFERPAEFAPIEGRTPYAFFVDGADLWIGTDRGLFRNRDGRTEEAYAAQLSSIEVRGVRRMRDHQLWLATALGPMRESGGRLEPVLVAQPEGARAVRVLAEGPDGSVFLGGPTGCFELRNNVFEQLPPSERGRPMPVSALLPLANGGLLAGGQSPSIWWRNEGQWREFTPVDGIPLNTAGALTIDRNGWLWVAGVMGLYKLRVAELEAYAAGRIVQLHGDMVLSISGSAPGAQKASCCNSSGSSTSALVGDDLWLPTPDGIVRVPVNGIARNAVVPEVRIERLRHGGQWREHGDDLTTPLPAADRDIDIDFTVLSFRDPKSVSLKFQLVGYDRDWRPVENALHRRATYTNLPPRAYVFRVMGANDAGVWNERAAELRFRIAPRFVETWWFLAAMSLAAVALAFAAFRLRTFALMRERTRLGRLVAERTAALEAANLALLEVSETDALTRLNNRRFLFERLPSDLADLQRRALDSEAPAHVCGFLMADLDHFKRINDQYGHEVGDAVLRHVAHVLRATVRSNDYVVRWGGEEFVLVLRDLPRGELQRLAESVRRAVADSSADVGNGIRVPITVSLGGVEYPLFGARPHALDWNQHVELADNAMYQAKKAGRNTWAIYRPSKDAALLMSERLLEGPIVDLIAAGVVELELRPSPEPDQPAKVTQFPA